MKKRFEWKALIKKLGKFKLGYIIIITLISAIIFGYYINKEGIFNWLILTLETIFINEFKDFINTVKEVSKEYTIENKNK